MDPYKHLQISVNPDATSITRHATIPLTPPDTNPNSPTVSKDVSLNNTHKTFLRIYLPTSLINTTHRLPVILHFHGGGFILFSAATSFFHSAVSNRAANIPAIIVSVDYRLAPEHRLPAAYDDAVDALTWLQDHSDSDPWIKKHADLSKVYIMGSSAGANIAYHLGLRSLDLKLGSVKVCGLILNEPYFGGEERTESEEKSTADKILPLASNDLMWELSLPVGAGRDHEYCNPTRVVDKRVKLLSKCMVKGFVGDPLYDRQKEFVEMMRNEGVKLEVSMECEGYHGIEMLDENMANQLVEDCRKFIYG